MALIYTHRHYCISFFSCGHSTLHLAVSVSRSEGNIFKTASGFSHYCSCPTVRDWIAVYPALFLF